LDQNPLEASVFRPIISRGAAVVEGLEARFGERTLRRLNYPVLHALGNNAYQAFTVGGPTYVGDTNLGLVFLENTKITPKARTVFGRSEALVAGSTWCRDVMVDQGLGETMVGIQGVDRQLFHPAPRHGFLKDRFTIFLGGKLEFRKGHDIALEAVRRFHERHDDAFVIGIWGQSWLDSKEFQQFRHAKGNIDLLQFAEGDKFDWPAAIEAIGLGERDVMIFRTIPHRELASVMREADVALFPNRAEGGTNLVAMEAMACGVPTILSANTGHLDIIQEGACYPLRHQRPVVMNERGFGTDGWGESDVDEIVEALEQIYQDREAARQVGLRGAEFMASFDWDLQLAELLKNLELD
jgi:glycosyltransferase involved in cell wall biosynthesis